ncbi:hypothetical protein ACFLXR_004500 [Salmonella enterica]
MKRKFVIIYILMIVVGIIGLFSFGNEPITQSEVTMQKQTTVVTIKKAVAIRKLYKGEIIDKNDYKIENAEVSKEEAEKYRNENPDLIISWAVKNDVVKGETLSITSGDLVRPGTQEYYELFTNPGSIVYTFALGKNDNFLLDNVKPGSGIDIYLIYGFELQGDLSREELMSPPSALMRRGLKRIIQNKKVLGIHKADIEKKNGIASISDGSQIVVELNSQDIKVLKALELNTQLIILPASDKEISNDNINIDEYLPIYERNSLDTLYLQPEFSAPEMINKKMSGSDVNELRG